MNSVDDKKKLEENSVASGASVEEKGRDSLDTPLDAPLLYNDVVMDASELDLELDFKVEELDNAGNAAPFRATEFTQELKDEADFAAIPKIQADQKVLETRQEPVLSEGTQAQVVEHFAAVDEEDITATTVENAEETAAVAPPTKKRKGSVLGMGWFQGFNLFICGIIFLGLATFSYFIFGEKPLYTGKLPKYVVIGNEDLGSMGALNPAIPEEERQAYIYVPKVERTDEEHILQDKPVLDAFDQEALMTKVELQSGDSSSEEEIVHVETEEAPAFTLLSVDHNADGISREDLESVEAFIQQAEMAFMQGNYVGVDENDAYYFYQQALEIDRKNRQAEQGLASIADIYYRSAYDAFSYGNLDIAKQYLMIGLKVAPNHRPLLELETRIEQQPELPTYNHFNDNNNGSFGGFDFN